MSTLKRTLKGLVIGGICGVGLCAVAKKLRLSDRLAELAQNVEGVPFPGTRLYSFLASHQLRSLYTEIAAEIAKSGIDGKVLDLGTDMGYLPIELARINPTLTIAGIDTHGDMAQIASANARTEGVSGRIEFGTGDPTKLPFPGRYFRLVVGANILHHWAKPREVFEEVHHLLEPGGEFWIYDYKKDIPNEVWDGLGDRLQAHQRMLLQIGPAMAARDALGEDEITRLAEETHFETVSIEDRSLTMFRESIPAFSMIRLRKPETGRD